jgi:protease-4
VNALFFVGSIFAMASDESALTPDQQLREKVLKAGGNTKIARIAIEGIISNDSAGIHSESMVVQIKRQLEQATKDPDVRAILLAIDSPGGEVTASDLIYQAVRKARAVKPVVVSMGSVAASGGYYIALGGSQIFANDTTFTGSIGVIMQSINYTGLIGKVGVDMVTFKSGKFKDMLSGARAVTPEEREYVQSLVMETYHKFVGIVATERKLPVESLVNGVADGRVLSGMGAFQAKLVDALGDEDLALQKALQLGGDPRSRVIEYITRGGLLQSLLYARAESAKPVKIDLQASLGTPLLTPGRLYYLPSVLAP